MLFFKATSPKQTQFAEMRENNMQYEPTCPKCTRGSSRLKPLSIAFNDTKPLGDFTWLAPDVFVSERAREVLENLEPQDFKFEPIVIRGRRQEVIWHVDVIARCHIAPECDVQLLEKCIGCGREVFSTWLDGLKVESNSCHHDIFRLVEHWGMIFLSEKAVVRIKAAKLTNIDFIPMEDIKDSLAWMRPRK